jgi:DNA-binding GntR family transcriptional regulator
VQVVKRLFDFRLGPLFDQLHSHFETNDVWQDAICEHREILTALRSKNPDLARAAMQHHMGIAYKRLTSSLTNGKKRPKPLAGAAGPSAPAGKTRLAASRKKA